ncbi:UNVERIFIED_CONTAM: hypothetical protein K2H54_050762 [Gekko kuhli]
MASTLGVYWQDEEVERMLEILYDIEAGPRVMPSTHLQTLPIFQEVSRMLSPIEDQHAENDPGEQQVSSGNGSPPQEELQEDVDSAPIIIASSADSTGAGAATSPTTPEVVEEPQYSPMRHETMEETTGPPPNPEPAMDPQSSPTPPEPVVEPHSCQGCQVLERRLSALEGAIDQRSADVPGRFSPDDWCPEQHGSEQ